MPGAYLWAWTGAAWVKVECDIDGYLKVDMSAISLGDLADVRVPAPGDQNFLYWDAVAGEWTYRILVEDDIPVEIARDAEVATAVSDHAALTTGVHGVAAKHVAAIASAGAEAPLLFDTPLFTFGWYYEDWKTIDLWTSVLTGTAALSQMILNTRLSTGATSGSTSVLHTPSGFTHPHYAHRRRFFSIFSRRNLTASKICLYLLKSGEAMPPTDTSEHGGFKIINGEIWATNADGITETATDTGISIAAVGTGASLEMRAVAGTIEFYVVGILKATHTTNLPSSWDYMICLSIENTAAVEQIAQIGYLASSGQ